MENSLCSDCKFNKDCSLTSNKNFIWSCSEYEVTAINEADQAPLSTHNTFAYDTTERAIEII